jgi:hypothetical protein
MWFLIFIITLSNSQNNFDFDRNFITEYVNIYRIIHQAPNVTYDYNIELSAKNWSNYLANNNLFIHSTNNYGENIAMEYNIFNYTECIINAINAWYAEVNNYNYTDPGNNYLTYGHFTQLVWKNTKKIGVGISLSTITNKIYIVMNFDPAGNYIGTINYISNVLPAISFQSPPPLPLPYPPMYPSYIPMPVPYPPMPLPYPPMPLPYPPMPLPYPPMYPSYIPMPVPYPPMYPSYIPMPLPYPPMYPSYIPMPLPYPPMYPSPIFNKK